MKIDTAKQVLPDTQVKFGLADGAVPAGSGWLARCVVLVRLVSESSDQHVTALAERLTQGAGLHLRVVYCAPDPNAEPAAADQLAEQILREAGRDDVELLVIDGLPSQRGGEQAALAQSLLRRCQRPALFVGSATGQPLVMAATDCSDPALPVLRAAWQLAAVLGSQIVLVHNIDQTGSQFAERIGMPLSPELADVLALRSREWLENAAAVSDVMITREVDNAQGVLAAAQRLDASLLVVGVKPQDQAPHGTALQILLRSQHSLLLVPLSRSPLRSETVQN